MVCYEKIPVVTSLVVTPRAAAEVGPRNSCGQSHNADRGRMHLYENKRRTCEISLGPSRLDFLAFPTKYSLLSKIVGWAPQSALYFGIRKCRYNIANMLKFILNLLNSLQIFFKRIFKTFVLKSFKTCVS